MSCMCHDIAELQRQTAAMPSGELQYAIYRSLDQMDMDLESMKYLCLRTWADDSAEAQVKEAQTAVLMHALMAAVCLRELTRRPGSPASIN